ncbi:MAG: (2Fe-2S)-binding protein [Rhodospirillales bacterium]|nr:(2Fe-2S)-binding protein [Rhodospirillales bacterium]MDE2197743.1 (2Fe-2S)-binding protein [Rhodospirillales bacterium]MDE2575131.1 (2Fe-2S)-binding protein [Rhodospirillales bacterium]
MSGACLLAEHGAQILVLDEQPAPGGQIYRAVERVATQGRTALDRLGGEYAAGVALAARFRASGCAYWPGSTVWQVTPERSVWVSRNGRSVHLRADVILLATGAMERPVPVPGWTLPGVMTVGAVQILLKSAALLPSVPFVLAGSGPLPLLVAQQCLAAGARPAAFLDTGSPSNMFAAMRHLPGALGLPARRMLAKGLALRAALRRSGVRVFRNVRDMRIEGDHAAEAIRFRSGRAEHRVEAQLVALHDGVIPSQQITRLVGCAHVWDARQRCFRPQLDDWGNSSVEGVMVAGDAAGIGGAASAALAGRLAAFEALRLLGRIDAAQRDKWAAADRRAMRAERAVRPLLERMFPPRPEILCPADDVVVCRCEEVTAGALRQAVAQGCQGPNQAKSFLRCGMGPCQGRLCGPVVTEVIAAARGQTIEETGYFRIRPPLKPVTLGEIALLET